MTANTELIQELGSEISSLLGKKEQRTEFADLLFELDLFFYMEAREAHLHKNHFSRQDINRDPIIREGGRDCLYVEGKHNLRQALIRFGSRNAIQPLADQDLKALITLSRQHHYFNNIAGVALAGFSSCNAMLDLTNSQRLQEVEARLQKADSRYKLLSREFAVKSLDFQGMLARRIDDPAFTLLFLRQLWTIARLRQIFDETHVADLATQLLPPPDKFGCTAGISRDDPYDFSNLFKSQYRNLLEMSWKLIRQHIEASDGAAHESGIAITLDNGPLP
jgi:hypothetical protein